MRQTFADWASTGSPLHVAVVGAGAIVLAVTGYVANERMWEAVDHVSLRRVDQPRQLSNERSNRESLFRLDFGQLAGQRPDAGHDVGDPLRVAHCVSPGCVSPAHFVAGGR